MQRSSKRKRFPKAIDNGRQGNGKIPSKLTSSPDRRWMRTLLMILILLGFLAAVYVIAPVRYTGPRFRDSEEAAEARQAKSSEIAGDSDEDDILSHTVEESSSCQELMAEAESIFYDKNLHRERAELALDMLATCALKEPENAAVRWNLAASLVQMHRTEEALQFIDEALTLDPTNKQYLRGAGELLARLGHFKRAIKCFENYLEVALYVPSWESLLAMISVQREDELEFLHHGGSELISLLEVLLDCYLHDQSLIKAGYLYKVIIKLREPENARDRVTEYAFFCFGIGDIQNGIWYLRILTQQQFMLQGYGDEGQAFEVVLAHSLRLLASGLDANILSIGKNLLMVGQPVWEELEYYCDLTAQDKVDFSVYITQLDMQKILVKCLLVQGVIPGLIKSGAEVHAENMYGWTPLLQLISLNSPQLFQQLLAGGADPHSKTALQITALHIAAMKGSDKIIPLLAEHGLNDRSKDILNRTTMDFACQQRWSTKAFVEALAVPYPDKCPTELLYVPPLNQRFKHGGWLPSAIELPVELTKEQCDFDVIGYNVDTETLLLQYIVMQRPVLVRNATNRHYMKELFQTWQRSKLEKSHGSLKFKEVLVPYAESFGYNISLTTLKDFLDKMNLINKEQGEVKNALDAQPPNYIFETVPQDSPILEHFETPRVLNPSVTHISTAKMQFYVGPALSGAPAHFHRSSWNVLIYGQKRWFVFPPEDAFYSKQHVWDWWRESYRLVPKPKAWECVQNPGDMVFIPDMWGHAVLNLQESTGVASEFIFGSSEFSL